MKIIIVGGGDVGFQLAKQLIAEQNDVVIIENRAARADEISNKLDCLVINESANNIATLVRAGISDADYLISVADIDEVNLVCCGLAAQYSPFKIARVRNLDYQSTQILKANLKAVDLIINPEMEASEKIIQSIEHGAISDIILFEKGDMHMRNLLISDDSLFIDQTVQQVRKSLQLDFLVAGIVRHNHFIIPTGDTKVEKEDNLYILASTPVLDEIFTQIGKPRDQIQNILIVGGGIIGRHVADYFVQKKELDGGPLKELTAFFSPKARRTEIKNIMIIDRDYEQCKLLVEQFPTCSVINADISDETIFEEEKLNEYDLIMTATDNHELNVISALYAKKLGIKRAVSIVSNINYIHIAIRLGIDVVVSPKNSIIDPILKHIRTGTIHAIHSIADTEVDILEVKVLANSRIAGQRLKDLGLPKDTLILSVNRQEKNVIPGGDFTILPEDNLIILSRFDSVSKLDKILSGE